MEEEFVNLGSGVRDDIVVLVCRKCSEWRVLTNPVSVGSIECNNCGEERRDISYSVAADLGVLRYGDYIDFMRYLGGRYGYQKESNFFISTLDMVVNDKQFDMNDKNRDRLAQIYVNELYKMVTAYGGRRRKNAE